MLKSILKSRGFWSCLGTTVPAVAAVVVGDEPAGPLVQQALLAWVAFVGVTATRYFSGKPTFYAKQGE